MRRYSSVDEMDEETKRLYEKILATAVGESPLNWIAVVATIFCEEMHRRGKDPEETGWMVTSLMRRYRAS